MGVDRGFDAIAWKYQSDAPWMYLPPECGSWTGVYTRLRNWAIDRTWQKVFTALVARADADVDLDWILSVDLTVGCAHQHAAGAPKKGREYASSLRSNPGRAQRALV